MKQLQLLFVLLMLCFSLQAQEKITFHLKNQAIEFNISEDDVYIEYSEKNKKMMNNFSLDDFKELSNESSFFKIKKLQGKYRDKVIAIQKITQNRLKRIEPVLVFRDGTNQILKGELNIKLKPNIKLKEVLKDISYSFIRNEYDENLYLVKLNYETFKMVNLIDQLKDDNKIEFIEPNFLREIKTHSNDPFFSSQWSIKNQGYLNGRVGADMDVEAAWNYATGTGIKVAIIDTGVDLNHPDLQTNLLPGYDATGEGSNGNHNGNAHGTACAGIVAAIGNNNLGVSGVAYNSKIIPIKIFNSSDLTSDNIIANAINWAWQNGADVLSNSYGGGSYSSTIESAINNAVSSGRNGKGSVVLFSSGNDNGSVSFPSSVSNAISVGASSMCDERKTPNSCDGESWWGSNYGSKLDVVAPGVKIYTTDISSTGGYTTGDYVSNYNGTSSACPNAAAVVALILSTNPELTQADARRILESNVDKVSGYSYRTTSGQSNGTWNSDVGYGRINARKAVEEAVSSIWIGVPQISFEYDPDYNYVTVNMIGANGTDIHRQGITSTSWTTISSEGGCSASFSGSGFSGLGNGPCTSWRIRVRVTATNAFGTTTSTITVLPPVPPEECFSLQSLSEPNTYKIIPCNFSLLETQANALSNTNQQVFVNDIYGNLVYETTDEIINLSMLNNSIYIINIVINNKHVLSQKIFKQSN
ncbi:hypothetical protein EI427_25725 (plasmid) [Flammeovirga pectinis]|uniref:Peptidase S8/S53 domain-containing protein n=1 Tax=Flammeovirga pectinis TaxID=2494373 RepID=A0A3S9PBU0_9BACT|nr:S8 family serine peptidase [Flammeovirga pectinis]AZQ65637.1 hypothetical protein EI427_25725 [Flammeovirga pectinis]